MSSTGDRHHRLGRWCLSFLVGCALGVLFHYMLYRLALPVEPFIYVAF
jgi:hypothetical protein